MLHFSDPQLNQYSGAVVNALQEGNNGLVTRLSNAIDRVENPEHYLAATATADEREAIRLFAERVNENKTLLNNVKAGYEIFLSEIGQRFKGLEGLGTPLEKVGLCWTRATSRKKRRERKSSL